VQSPWNGTDWHDGGGAGIFLFLNLTNSTKVDHDTFLGEHADVEYLQDNSTRESIWNRILVFGAGKGKTPIVEGQ
jgi:hypothetical protein